MTFASKNHLRDSLFQIENQEVYEIKAGKGTGSVFTMYFSCEKDKFNRDTSDMIMVFCSWKILLKNKYLCTWRDRESLIKKTLIKLINKTITNIEINNSYDIIITFSHNYYLYINCDNPIDSDYDIDSDYFIKTNNKILAVLRGNIIH